MVSKNNKPAANTKVLFLPEDYARSHIIKVSGTTGSILIIPK